MVKKEIFDTNSGREAQIGWDKYLDETDGTRNFGYIYGYKTGADELVETGVLQDTYVFPIVFNYRQYLELVLKNIYKTNKPSVNFTSFLNGAGHNLSKIFFGVKPILIALKIPSDEIDFIESVLEDFIEIDSSSFNFRYPYDKRNNSTIDTESTSSGILKIDLVNLKENIDEVDKILFFIYN